MKKPIIFSVLFFIISSVSSFGQDGGVWIDEIIEPNTRLRGGNIEINGNVYRIFPNSNLRNVDLTGANLTWSILTGSKLNGAILKDANLRGSNLAFISLPKANLQGADLSFVTLRNSLLRDANFTGAKLLGAYLRNVDLTGADLTGADLTGADLTGADLTGADFTGANLTGADFTGADFTRTNFTGAILSGVVGLNAIIGGFPDKKDQKILELESQLAEYQNGRAVSIVTDSSNGIAIITFNIEESEDLKTWQATGEKITKTIQLKDGKKFYRFALDK